MWRRCFYLLLPTYYSMGRLYSFLVVLSMSRMGLGRLGFKRHFLEWQVSKQAGGRAAREEHKLGMGKGMYAFHSWIGLS